MPFRILLLRRQEHAIYFNAVALLLLVFVWNVGALCYTTTSSSTCSITSTSSGGGGAYYYYRWRKSLCFYATDVIPTKRRNTRIKTRNIGGHARTTRSSTTILYDSSSAHPHHSSCPSSSSSSTEMTSEEEQDHPNTSFFSSPSPSSSFVNNNNNNNNSSNSKRSKVMKRPKRVSQMDTHHHHHHQRKNHERSSSSSNNKNNNKSGMIVTEEELAHHVSSMYIRGPGGIFNEMAKKRERNKGMVVARKQNGSTSTLVDGGTVGDVGFDDEYEEYLRKLDRHPALVLNADFQPLSVLPLSIWPWQETIKALFSGKVSVVDVYPNLTIRAVNMNVPLPSVIALTEYVKQPNQVPAFTRRNVFLRDGYKCQYCSKSFMTRDLSLDHVNPRCNGGRLEWTNTVTSCRKCNGRKGSTPPHELKFIGMKLVREPRIPSKWELAANAEKMVPKRVHPTWRPFLGMNLLPGDEQDLEGNMDAFFEEDFEY